MSLEPTNWSRRYKDNVELLRSGSLANIAVVAERLEARERTKGLSSGEKRLLERAQTILGAEVLFGWDDGCEGEQGGTAGVREPRRPEPSSDDGPVSREVPDDMD